MEQKEETSAESKGGFGSEARERVNKSYSTHTASLEGLGAQPESELPSSVQEEAPTETSPAEEVSEVSPVVEADKGFESAESAPVEATKEKQGDEAKTVSLDALHEERERRKEFQAEVAKLKEQQDVLLKDIKDRKELDELSGQTVEDRDTEIIRMKRELEELKNKDTKRDADSLAREAEESQTKLKESIASADKSLADEGFPGFAFAQSVVAAEINKEVAKDSDNAYMLNDPPTWMRIYKERVYPGMKSAFSSKERAEKNAEKEALKDEAQLAGNAGKPNTPSKKKEKEEDWTYDKYLTMRKEKSRF